MNHLCPLNHLLVMTSSDSWGLPYEAQTQNASHMQGMPTTSKTWTHMEDQMEDPTSTEPTHMYHLNILASCLESNNVRTSPLQTGPFTLHMMEWLLSSKNSM